MAAEKAVFELAKVLVREPMDAGELAALESMCRAAEEELSTRLREELTAEDVGDRFTLAAATLGLSLYVGAGSGGQAESFTAGSMSLRRRSAGGTAEAAELLRRQAELMLAGSLIDGGFEFRAVRA